MYYNKNTSVYYIFQVFHLNLFLCQFYHFTIVLEVLLLYPMCLYVILYIFVSNIIEFLFIICTVVSSYAILVSD